MTSTHWDNPNNIAEFELLPPARPSTYHVTDDADIFWDSDIPWLAEAGVLETRDTLLGPMGCECELDWRCHLHAGQSTPEDLLATYWSNDHP